MRLLIRMTARSIRNKPLRTAVIVLCLAAVSLTFSLCLTVSVSSKQALEQQIRSGSGNTDIVLSDSNGFDALPALPDGCSALPALRAGSYLQIHDISNFKYVQKKSITVFGTDAEQAQAFGLLPACTAPQDGEAVISYSLAQRFGFSVGDVLTLPCAGNAEVTLTVSEIVLNKGLLSIQPQTVIVSENTAKSFFSDSGVCANIIYLDVPDSSISETSEALREQYPALQVQQIAGNPETEAVIKSLTRTFYILFAVTLLMILFIVSAFAKNIAAERLSLIGTLRSIGAEKTAAAAVLLTECALYGLLGGSAGTVLFLALKDVLLGDIIPSVSSIGGSVSVPVWIPLTGLLLSAAVSCAVSLAAVLRTSNTPVRELIFSGKDSVYRPSKSSGCIGLFLMFCALFLGASECGFAAGLAGLAALVSGLCLTVPLLLSALSARTARCTDGSRFPVLRLALIQAGTKKSAVTGTVICTAVMLLSTSLLVLWRSADSLYSARIYDCDVIASNLSERAPHYALLTADKTEFIYNTEETAELNGKSAQVSLFGYDGFSMFSGLCELPESLGSSEIALDRVLMQRLGISEGDSVALKLKTASLRPVTLELTAVPGIDSAAFDQRCIAAAVSLETYRRVYHDYPSMLLADGDAQLIAKQLADKFAETETAEAYYAREAESAESITGLLFALAVSGILLAAVSVSGEQLTGFSQRRHELAVLRSQGMTLGQLSGMLFIETALTVLIPAVIFLMAGRFALRIIALTLGSLEIHIPTVTAHFETAAFLAAASAAVMLTALIPVCALRRMNAAEELKQE